ncbi:MULTISPECIES: acyl-CoA dehydrogenase family protein [Pyrobaculum]|uniref:Acyl-CoA dehydrogenase n=1 Tax=Pyrobaculum arsenaticum TaxID=121277 RepID=A0A7L4P8M6_9CREN|nr:acyl-CoA dehydrogenase family protein [Pyrobaculum arsenaticum]MCY0890230.1 acyl-CoA dehydrogenase family protein [Pyrobaculum arsenaticum]NYR15023.1 acyl-CoA dehydrogenase [Pyrobaculum arsenaticum]
MNVLSEEHKLTIKAIREFVDQYVRPKARSIDKGEYPRQLLRQLGKMNLLASTLPQDVGGAGADTLTHILIVEELARASPSLATIMEVQSSMLAENLYHNGNKVHREEVVPKLASGEAVGAFTLSEPCCGSDAAAIVTRAEKRGGEWVINGTKTWITSGLYADYFLLFARTGSLEARHKAITAFLLRRSNCIETTPIEVMGVRGTGTAEVKLNDCRAGDDDVVGEVNGGWKIAMWGINMGRLNVGTIGLGIAEEAFYEAYSYAKKRVAFGKTIAEFQVIQHYLAEMYARVEMLRSFIYSTAKMKDSGDPNFPLYAQVAKLMGSRTAVDVVRLAVQIQGGYGYSKDSHLEMLYRDAKATEIYEGANEIILNTIYKFMREKIA